MRRRRSPPTPLQIPTSGRDPFDDWGGYLQVNWGYKPGHVVGLRVDSVGGDRGDPPRRRARPAASASRRSLTWFPTEYSKLRLQYNFDHGDAFAHDEHSALAAVRVPARRPRGPQVLENEAPA